MEELTASPFFLPIISIFLVSIVVAIYFAIRSGELKKLKWTKVLTDKEVIVVMSDSDEETTIIKGLLEYGMVVKQLIPAKHKEFYDDPTKAEGLIVWASVVRKPYYSEAGTSYYNYDTFRIIKDSKILYVGTEESYPLKKILRNLYSHFSKN